MTFELPLRMRRSLARLLLRWGGALADAGAPEPDLRAETDMEPDAAPDLAEPAFDARQVWLDRVAHVPAHAWQGRSPVGGMPLPRAVAPARAQASTRVRKRLDGARLDAEATPARARDSEPTRKNSPPAAANSAREIGSLRPGPIPNEVARPGAAQASSRGPVDERPRAPVEARSTTPPAPPANPRGSYSSRLPETAQRLAADLERASPPLEQDPRDRTQTNSATDDRSPRTDAAPTADAVVSRIAKTHSNELARVVEPGPATPRVSSTIGENLAVEAARQPALPTPRPSARRFASAIETPLRDLHVDLRDGASRWPELPALDWDRVAAQPVDHWRADERRARLAAEQRG